jgi:hypothetical protein
MNGDICFDASSRDSLPSRAPCTRTFRTGVASAWTAPFYKASFRIANPLHRTHTATSPINFAASSALLLNRAEVREALEVEGALHVVHLPPFPIRVPKDDNFKLAGRGGGGTSASSTSTGRPLAAPRVSRRFPQRARRAFRSRWGPPVGVIPTETGMSKLRGGAGSPCGQEAPRPPRPVSPP